MADRRQNESLPEEFRRFTQGIVTSEGWRRLSVGAGVVGLVGYCGLMAVVLALSHGTQVVNWQRAIPVAFVAFAVPWDVVQLIGWIVEGFKQQR